MKSRRILIMGSTGFIGLSLKRALSASGIENEIISVGSDLDITTREAVDKIISYKPEIIIHCAGKSFVPDSWENPLEFYSVNTLGTLHVAESARKLNAKIIYLSTFVYGEPYIIPITESNSTATFNPYASSKFTGEILLNDYARLFGIHVNILRVFNVYGPGQRPEFLIPTLIRQYRSGKEFRVKDLTPKRDYIYLDDLISAVIAATNTFDGFQVYNVASGISYSVGEVISMIQQAGGREIPVYSEEVRRGNEVLDTRADIEKIKRELSWSPRISFPEGIKNLLAE